MLRRNVGVKVFRFFLASNSGMANSILSKCIGKHYFRPVIVPALEFFVNAGERAVVVSFGGGMAILAMTRTRARCPCHSKWMWHGHPGHDGTRARCPCHSKWRWHGHPGHDGTRARCPCLEFLHFRSKGTKAASRPAVVPVVMAGSRDFPSLAPLGERVASSRRCHQPGRDG